MEVQETKQEELEQGLAEVEPPGEAAMLEVMETETEEKVEVEGDNVTEDTGGSSPAANGRAVRRRVATAKRAAEDDGQNATEGGLDASLDEEGRGGKGRRGGRKGGQGGGSKRAAKVASTGRGEVLGTEVKLWGALRAAEDEVKGLTALVDTLRTHVDRLTREKMFLLNRLLRYERFGHELATEEELARGAQADEQLDETTRRAAQLADGSAADEDLATTDSYGISPKRRGFAAAGSPLVPASTSPAASANTAAAAVSRPVKRGRGSGSHDPASPASALSTSGGPELCSARSSTGPCKTLRVNGLSYCWRHAHLDPTSDYTLCAFVEERTGKHCKNVVKKNRGNPYCSTHEKLHLQSLPS